MTQSKAKNNQQFVDNSMVCISLLPDLCLAKIFQYLDIHQRMKVEQVCRRWKDVALRSYGDIKVLVLNGDHCLFTYVVDILHRCGRYLQKITVYISEDGEILSTISRHCSNLCALSIQFPKRTLISEQSSLSTAHLGLECFTKLKHLEITNCEITQDLLAAIGTKETLITLHLQFCNRRHENARSFNGNFIGQLANIEELNLSNVGFLNNDLIRQIGANCLRIQRLTLQPYYSVSQYAPIVNLTTLCQLSVINSLAVNDSLLKKIVQHCPSIEHLDLSLCTFVTDRGICWLQQLENLTELKIMGQSDVTDWALSGLHKLVKLECSLCPYIRDPGIVTLLRYAENLKFLNLRGTSVTTVTLVEAKKWSKKRPNFTQLVVYVCINLYSVFHQEDAEDSTNCQIVYKPPID